MSRIPARRARTAAWIDDVAFVTEAEHERIDNENRFPRARPERRRRRSKAAPAESPEPSRRTGGTLDEPGTEDGPEPSPEQPGA